MTILIGDIHASAYYVRDILPKFAGHETIQLGDFGAGFFSSVTLPKIEEFHATGNHRMIRGNHDNPDEIKTMPGFIPDGSVQMYGDTKVMFVGGAWSIDRDYRTPGFDWWAGEECSHEELDVIIERYADEKPDVMITHDCPYEISARMFVRYNESKLGKYLVMNRTCMALQDMLDIHRPREWYFGHWHISKTLIHDGTHFECLGINATKEVTWR